MDCPSIKRPLALLKSWGNQCDIRRLQAYEKSSPHLHEISTQCAEFWEGEIELPHVEQVSCREAIAELVRQADGEGLDQTVAVFRAGGTTLLLDDFPSDVPISLDHDGIGGDKDGRSHPGKMARTRAKSSAPSSEGRMVTVSEICFFRVVMVLHGD